MKDTEYETNSLLKDSIIEYLQTQTQTVRINQGGQMTDKYMRQMLQEYGLKLREYIDLIKTHCLDESFKADMLSKFKQSLKDISEYGYDVLHMAALYNNVMVIQAIGNFGRSLHPDFTLTEFDVMDRASMVWHESAGEDNVAFACGGGIKEVAKAKYKEGTGQKYVLDYLLERNFLTSEFVAVVSYLKGLGINKCGPHTLIRTDTPIQAYFDINQQSYDVIKFFEIVELVKPYDLLKTQSEAEPSVAAGTLTKDFMSPVMCTESAD